MQDKDISEVSDLYERISGQRPQIKIEEHKNPTQISLSPDKTPHSFILRKGAKAADIPLPTLRATFGDQAFQRAVKDLHRSFTGETPSKITKMHKKGAPLGLEIDPEGTVNVSGDIRTLSHQGLRKLFADRFHTGVNISHLGQHDPEVKDKINHTLTSIMEKLSPENKLKLRGLHIISYTADSPELAKLLGRVTGASKGEDKALTKNLLTTHQGFAAGADREKNRIHLMRPEKNKDAITRVLAHEIYHILQHPTKVVAPFIDKPHTTYAAMYKTPEQRAKESMADLFGYFHHYLSTSKEKNPSNQILGFINKAVPGASRRELRFKAYLARKLHTLQGIPVPHIGIKKVLQ